MAQEHTVRISDLPDATLEAELRRLYERNDRETIRDQLEAEARTRDSITIPENPADTTWYVIELTEAETRQLEDGDGYAEAYQLSKSIEAHDDESGTFSAPDDDDMRVMKISAWALRNIPDEYRDRATPLADSDYDHDFFG